MKCFLWTFTTALKFKWMYCRLKLPWHMKCYLNKYSLPLKWMCSKTKWVHRLCWLDPYHFTETVTITPADARWVGAWWLGYLIAGAITLMSAVPFWFLPKSLPMPVDKHDTSCTPEQTRFIKDSPIMEHKFRPEEPANLHQMAKGVITNTSSYNFGKMLIPAIDIECYMQSVEPLVM